MEVTGKKAKAHLERYLNALKKGLENEARSTISECLEQGLQPDQIYLQVLAPAQIEIGELWHAGKLNVAQEHLATEITLQQMDFLRQQFQAKSRLGLQVVVTTAEGETHSLGARMVSDFLFADGWQSYFLGASMPIPDLVEFVLERGIRLVVLSSTLEEYIPQMEKTIAALREAQPDVKVIVGGRSFRNQPQLASKIDADGSTTNPEEAVHLARRLFHLQKAKKSLDIYLKELGFRIQQMRKSKKWSQQKLAKLSGLDRTYISGVEHGKQNLTLGAVSKLADAFETPLEDLLVENEAR